MTDEKPERREKVQTHLEVPEVKAVEVHLPYHRQVLRFAYQPKRGEGIHVSLAREDDDLSLNALGDMADHLVVLSDAHLGHLIAGLQKLRARLQKKACECGKKHE